MIDVTKNKPMKGLVICSSFDFELQLSQTSFFNLQSCMYEFHGHQWSGFGPHDSEPVLFGIEEACKFSVAQNYKGKIYVSDATAMSWSRGHSRYTGSFDSPRIREIFDTLTKNKFGQRIWFWPPYWGKIEEHVKLLLTSETAAKTFFCL